MLKIIIDNLEFFLKTIESATGPSALDIRQLYKKTGYFTYDPAFMSTASCSSSITFIDGEQGILRYRGYDVVELAHKKDFLSTAYLLLYGDLPNEAETEDFINKIIKHSPLEVEQSIRSFPATAHPMSILIGAFAALAGIYYEKDIDYRVVAIAQISAIIAAIYRHINNFNIIPTDGRLNYAQNFLHMMFGDNELTQQEIFIKALDTIFILHADHEQNASTSTVRLSASSGTNPFAALAAGSSTLWGPAHGGANEAVIKMLNDIGSTDNVANFIDRVKAKKVRLMGFGHRVYKNRDPRATVIRDLCYKVLAASGNKDGKIFEVAQKLEEIALKDEYFLERKLYPNVDFYSGIILQSIGIPTAMFTNIFALSRTTGWVAQMYESTHDPEQKIGRPRQVYKGLAFRKIDENTKES